MLPSAAISTTLIFVVTNLLEDDARWKNVLSASVSLRLGYLFAVLLVFVFLISYVLRYFRTVLRYWISDLDPSLRQTLILLAEKPRSKDELDLVQSLNAAKMEGDGLVYYYRETYYLKFMYRWFIKTDA